MTLAQREEIAAGRARGDSIRAIAALLWRSPSAVSGSWVAMPMGWGAIGPPPRMHWPITARLDWVAAELNDRPRKRLEFKKPIEQI